MKIRTRELTKVLEVVIKKSSAIHMQESGHLHIRLFHNVDSELQADIILPDLGPGDAAISAVQLETAQVKKIAKLLKTVKADLTEIITAENNIIFKAGSKELSIPADTSFVDCLSDTLDEHQVISCRADQLAGIYDKVKSIKDKYMSNNAASRLHFNKENNTCFATDCKRLLQIDLPQDFNIIKNFSETEDNKNNISYDALQLLSEINKAGIGGNHCQIYRLRDNLIISLGCVTIQEKFADLRSPDATRVIPDKNLSNIVFNNKALQQVLNTHKNVSEFIHIDINRCNTDLCSFESIKTIDNTLRFGLKVTDNIESRSNLSGFPFEIAFSNKFLLEGLKLFNTDNICLQVSSETYPAKLQSDDLTYVLMPATYIKHKHV